VTVIIRFESSILIIFSLSTLRHLIHSHFFVTGAAKCPASLFCLRHLPQLSPHHRLLRLPVCLVSFAHHSIPAHRPTSLTKRIPEALRGHVRGRDQGAGDTASTTCKSWFIRNFPHPFRQGPDLSCSVMRKCWRSQGCSQRFHEGSKSYPGIHGHCRFQGRKCSRKTRRAVQGVY
jgi:hypothetical protein